MPSFPLPRLRVSAPPADRPLLLYDGDCGFCRQWIARWRDATGDRVAYEPSRDAAARFPEIPPERFAESVQLIEPTGAVYAGAEAVFRALAHAPGGRWPLWAYERLPGVAPAAERAYRLVARHRPAFSRLTRLLWGSSIEPPTYYVSRWMFLRLLGLIYLVAFVSLWTQIHGLVGSQGIHPAAALLERVHLRFGPESYALLPTLCWFAAGDRALHFLCGGGAALACLLAAGIAPTAALVFLWMFYLSLVSVCGVFLGFQWDILLLETGFLAIFLAPPQLLPRPSRESPPSRAFLGLLWWLLFRLMFSSGAVKLLGADPVWWDGTALRYHYETQPLPVWTSWYVHRLPDALQQLSVFVMFVIETAVPFLIPAPRRLRHLACGALVGLQVLILATGNYCFFNLLSIALCLLLLDDAAWPRWLRSWWAGPADALPTPRPRGIPSWITAPAAVLLFYLSTMELFTGRVGQYFEWPSPIRKADEALHSPFQALNRGLIVLQPFHLVSSYGLFQDMTTTRPEIVVEGSRDGRTWLPYEFKYKPGDPSRPPRFVAPHQPRLDWQMWFAALGTVQQNPWFFNFCGRLLQGSKDVLALLETNPFPDAPPRYIRAVVYDYRFTDPDTRRTEGTWWRREVKGLYCPELSLR